jgi:hypothetical protein
MSGDDETPPPGDDGDDAIFHNVTDLSGHRGKRGGGKPPAPKSKTGTKVVRVPYPVLPDADVDLDTLKRQATNPSRRAWAAFAMRKRMIPFTEIAEFLEYETASHAKAAVCAVLQATVTPEDTETLRQTIIAGLEDQLRRSITLASANTFRDADGTEYPNTDRIAWHKEARADYDILARVSGAQAAAQVQLLTPEATELDASVREIERLQGREVVEADVLELEEIRDAQ